MGKFHWAGIDDFPLAVHPLIDCGLISMKPFKCQDLVLPVTVYISHSNITDLPFYKNLLPPVGPGLFPEIPGQFPMNLR